MRVAEFCIVVDGGLGNLLTTVDEIKKFIGEAEHVSFATESSVLSALIKHLFRDSVQITSLSSAVKSRRVLIILNELSFHQLVQCFFAKRVLVLQTKFSSKRALFIFSLARVFSGWEIFISSSNLYRNSVADILAKAINLRFYKSVETCSEELDVTERAIEKLVLQLQDHVPREIIVHLGSGSFRAADKRASAEQFVRVINALVQKFEIEKIISIEGPDEIGISKKILSQGFSFDNKLQVKRPYEFEQLEKIFQPRESVFVGNDSFVAHYAAHMNLVSIVFFKPQGFLRFRHKSTRTIHVLVE